MSLPPNLDPRYPTAVSVVLIVAGVLLVGGCVGLLYVQPRPEYLFRDLCTVAAGILGVLMVLAGSNGANTRMGAKWPGEQ